MRIPSLDSERGLARLLFFWDYDTQWGADRSRMPGGPKSWGILEFENTERLLEIHARYQVPACFAVVGSAALPGRRPYHDPAQIRRIHESGHEIASHSHRHDWLPGLGRREVRETLRTSRETLETCLGAPVTAFVPPYNQPFDYPARLSISISERRSGSPERLSLGPLCEILLETGYRFCRVAYRPGLQRFFEKVTSRRLDRPVRPERVRGLICLRLNSAGGFAQRTQELIERCTRTGGYAVVYGHPHSLRLGGEQDERHLTSLLERVAAFVKQGRLRIMLPRDVLAESA